VSGLAAGPRTDAVPDASPEAVLSVRNLTVGFRTEDGPVEAVHGISFDVRRGEVLGVVGESGSGKSQSLLATLGLLTSNGHARGEALHDGRNLLTMPERELRRVRGRRIGMIFQDPLTSLTPHLRIGEQLSETLRLHAPDRLSRSDVRRRCTEWLERVHLNEPARRLEQYPHELSGGMRQRVMIAMTMLAGPELLIADEPTTALDVTVQAGILDLMRELQRDLGTSIVLVTHDMGVVAGVCDRVQVMNGGRIVESGTVDEIFHAPAEAYTRRLLAAVPRIDDVRAPPAELVDPHGEPLLRVEGLGVDFSLHGGLFSKRRRFQALEGVGLTLHAGETLGIVGESGSGKSTLARAILRLIEPTVGRVTWLGRALGELDAKAMRDARRDLQIVFQDPFASLNPSMPVVESIAEPLRVFEPALSRRGRRDRAREALSLVGLDDSFANRYPHELSGGQNQRVGIARATISRPKLLVCDEAVSALDVSVQARVLALLAKLQRELGLSMLFITHDLAVVSAVAHRVLVLYRGRVVEVAPTRTLFAGPRHPYTQRLLSAVPVADPRAERHASGPAGQAGDEDGAASNAGERLREVAPGHWVAEARQGRDVPGDTGGPGDPARSGAEPAFEPTAPTG